jgi:hypothetical protein
MAAKGSMAALAAGTALLLVGAATAAATPQQTSQRIFADLADNGRLDEPWTDAQIDRALHTPSLRGYEQPPRPAPIRPPAAVRSARPSVEAGRGLSLPFSGIDLALLGAVGVPILLLGASLGRLARVRPRMTPEGGPG